MASSVLTGFKKFIARGNVVDLAIGVVIGASFNTFVQALVTDFITPLITGVAHTPDLSGLTFKIFNITFNYGAILNALLSFVIISLAAYFLVVLPMNALLARIKRGECVDPTDKSCPECLSKIPIRATRCMYCTIPVDKTPHDPETGKVLKKKDCK